MTIWQVPVPFVSAWQCTKYAEIDRGMDAALSANMLDFYGNKSFSLHWFILVL
jgi:hypothetical protein